MQKNLDLLYYSVFVLDFMSHPSEKDIGDTHPPMNLFGQCLNMEDIW